MKLRVSARTFALTAVCLSLLVMPLPAGAQEVSFLASDWRSMPIAEFAAKAAAASRDDVLDGGIGVPVREYAAEQIRDVNFATANVEKLPVLGDLGDVAWKVLSSEERARIREQLLSRNDGWEGRSYEEVRGKVLLLIKAKCPLEAYEEARRWVMEGGTLEDIQNSVRGEDDLKHPLAPLAMKIGFGGAEPIYNGFQVSWSGHVVPPRAGSYRFSISPIDVNGSRHDSKVSKTMRVALDGQQLIAAGPGDWSHRGPEVQLAAGKPVKLEVSLDVRQTGLPQGALHALLLWEGPGIEQEVVASQYFQLPDGAGQGLQATYAWKDRDGRSREVTQTDPQIDFAWPLGGLLVTTRHVGPSRELASLSRVRWKDSLAEAKLSEYEDAGRVHPLLADPNTSAGLLSSADRQQFLQVLLDRPALLRPLDPIKFAKVYRAFRLGATDLALEVLGKWGAVHATTPSTMPDHVQYSTHDVERRNACYQLAMCLFHEQPGLSRAVQDQYLDLPGGGCSLPIAYTLNYGYKSAGEMESWIEYLEARLADDSLAGDARVTWLLARAHAEEIRHGREGKGVVAKERITAGQGWIDEARLVAQSPEMKVLGANETAARLAALGKFDAAHETLEQVSSGSGSNQGAQVAQWQQDIDAYQAQMAEHQATLKRAAKESHLQTLERRRQQAAQQGNQQAASRYEELLEAASQR